jgi:fucose permease
VSPPSSSGRPAPSPAPANGTAASGVVLAGLLVTAALPAAPAGGSRTRGTSAELLESEQSLLPFAGLALAIGCYVAAEIGVSSWLVRFLSAAPVSIATGTLGLFWGGLALGRLLFSWIADRFDPVGFAVVCTLAASAALVAAVASPFLPLAVVLFGLAGLWFGPVYPMIMTVGGSLYPHRLAALSGSLTTAAVIGGIIYPPLIGVMAEQAGVGVGMLGAGLLGVPTALALVSARMTSRRPATV